MYWSAAALHCRRLGANSSAEAEQGAAGSCLPLPLPHKRGERWTAMCVSAIVSPALPQYRFLPESKVNPSGRCVSSGRGAKPFLALLVIKKTLDFEGLVLRACAY